MRCSVVKGSSLALIQASTVPSKVENKTERQLRTKPVSGSRHCITDGETERDGE